MAKQIDVSDWKAPRTREALETALDSGRLFVHMRNGAWWQARRNGRTQLWKRDPDRFRIPLKAGLRAYGEATAEALADADLYRIKPEA